MTDGYKIKRILVRQNNQEKQIYPSGYKYYTPTANTLAYRPLKENLNDYSSHNKNWTTGTGTYANNMVTTTSYCSGPLDILPYTYSGNFTFIAWVDYDNTVGDSSTICPAGSMNKYPSLIIRRKQGAGWYLGNSGWREYTSSSISSGIHMLAVVRDGNTQYIYIDGSLVNSQSCSGVIGGNTGDSHYFAYLGGSDGGGTASITCGGIIVESTAFSSSDISNHFNTYKSNYGL